MTILAIKAGEPGFDLVVGACVASALLITGGLILLLVRLERGERKKRRGPEVKLNAGDEPVIEKKENDHG